MEEDGLIKDTFAVRPADPGDSPLMDPLAVAARAEGFRFVDRLIDDWNSGANRFSKPGERLAGVFDKGRPIAIGGLNHDPYARRSRIGRLRHLYVLPSHRRLGIGALLVRALLDGADMYFDRIRLRTKTAGGDRFYLALGFTASDDRDATHEWGFRVQSRYSTVDE